MSGDRYDVLVIGGGITGVGVAQAAAAAGHAVLLLEKSALGEGTSSRSSKLIHGGLRYLETWQLGLVRESLRERALMLRLAPELVRLRPFLIPIYASTRRGPWLIRAGLSLYALLGGLAPENRFRRLARNEWPEDDGLATAGLRAVFEFHDAQTDDRLLTAAVMRSAISLGAEAAVPAEFLRAERQGPEIDVEFREHGRLRHCRTRTLVNAAGPWASGLLARITPSPRQPRCELVQGAHVLLDRGPHRGIYYVESPRDGRAVFVMPYQGRCLVGTTETRFRGNPDEVRPLTSEINYLLKVFAHYFPGYGSDRGAIRDSFAGLRVLPADAGHAFHRSREVVLLTEDLQQPWLVTVLGGKLTTWRATARKVLRQLRPALPDRAPRADTARLPLSP